MKHLLFSLILLTLSPNPLKTVRGQPTSDFTNQEIGAEKNSLSGEIKVLRNLRYGDKPPGAYAADTSSDRSLDLFLPANSNGNTPVFLFVHGGGFAGGDKSALEDFWLSLAAEGVAVISANYRLYLKHHKTPGASASANMSKGLPQTGQFHPELQKAVHIATEDITQVLRWIKEKEDEYHFDLDRVALAGGSAGAMTALHLAFGSGQNILPLQAVVNLWGGLQDVSVIQKDAPPLLTFHGDQDKLIHVDYAYALDQRMKEVGSVSEMHILKGKGHAIYKIIAADYVDTIVSFLRKTPEANSF